MVLLEASLAEAVVVLITLVLVLAEREAVALVD
jgi:hypothetical protein